MAWQDTSATARGRDTSEPTAPPVSPSHLEGLWHLWVLGRHAALAARALIGNDIMGGLGPLAGFISGASGLPGLSPPAELWMRLHDLLKPSPAFYHFILTHFKWFWDIINSTFIRDTLMRLVLTGEGLEWVQQDSGTPPGIGRGVGRGSTAATMLSSSRRHGGHWAWVISQTDPGRLSPHHPVTPSPHHRAQERLPGQAAVGRRGLAGWAACVSPAVRPRLCISSHTPGCQPAGKQQGLSACCAPQAKGLLSSRAESSLWKYGAGPCCSCPHIHHFA